MFPEWLMKQQRRAQTMVLDCLPLPFLVAWDKLLNLFVPYFPHHEIRVRISPQGWLWRLMSWPPLVPSLSHARSTVTWKEAMHPQGPHMLEGNRNSSPLSTRWGDLSGGGLILPLRWVEEERWASSCRRIDSQKVLLTDRAWTPVQWTSVDSPRPLKKEGRKEVQLEIKEVRGFVDSHRTRNQPPLKSGHDQAVQQESSRWHIQAIHLEGLPFIHCLLWDLVNFFLSF